MNTFLDLKNFYDKQNLKMILAVDAETRVTRMKNGKLVDEVPSGGVAISLEAIAKAANAVYVARGKTEEERKNGQRDSRVQITDPDGSYLLKRLFFDQKDLNAYYYGFANQTLWPMCHVTFERPEFRKDWYEGYKKVNQRFAQAVREEIKGKTFVWVHDYQLCLVPKYLDRPKDTIIGMFWHIPWPTWEVFRILPQKKEILESMLQCNFLAFHRGYQVRNFLETVRREFEVRIDDETNTVYFNNNKTIVRNLPLGIDTEEIRRQFQSGGEENFVSRIFKSFIQPEQKQVEKEPDNSKKVTTFFAKHKVMLGADRLDYTKGLVLRLRAIELFFEKNPRYLGNVVYIGILAPSREIIPSYQQLKREVKAKAQEINDRFGRKDWKPIVLLYEVFPRSELLRFFQKAAVCLVTPRDDGMNLVSKEFVICASLSDNPGMLVLSQFAGSSIDLTQALIVNPYDTEEVASAMKKALEMSTKEKVSRTKAMVEVLDDRDVYRWAQDFIKGAVAAGRENRR